MTSSEIAGAPLQATPREEQPGSFLKRAEVRDALAWMRLLIDPTDAAAVVRALARPPVELRQVDLARVIALARRRKLDLVLGLAAAIESPQVPPEARDRIQRFLALHRSAAGKADKHLEFSFRQPFDRRLRCAVEFRERQLLCERGV